MRKLRTPEEVKRETNLILKAHSSNINHVREILKMHHWECVFELNAPEDIVERVKQLNVDSKEFTMEFRKCFSLSEIYCPHENIDRRAEYGIETVN